MAKWVECELAGKVLREDGGQRLCFLPTNRRSLVLRGECEECPAPAPLAVVRAAAQLRHENDLGELARKVDALQPMIDAALTAVATAKGER